MHLLITNQNRERIITMQDSEWICCCCCIRLITIVCVVYVRAYKPGLTFISHTCHYTQHKDQTPPTLLLCICIYYINKAILWVFSLNWSFHFEKYLPVDCFFFKDWINTQKAKGNRTGNYCSSGKINYPLRLLHLSSKCTLLITGNYVSKSKVS